MTERLEEVWGARTVGDVVAEDYRRAAVFETHGIDFCCGGGRTVRAACEEAGADLDAVARALSEAAEREAAQGATEPASWKLDVLADHIVAVHHGYVRASVPVLREFSAKVARVHGDRHPELLEIQGLVGELSAELERHMEDEEEILFPRIAALKSANRDGARGEIRATTLALEDDHARAAELLGRIRALSGGFAAPADACTTYRATYAKLAEFERDLHRHVHLENNVLFPRAAAMEEALGSSGTGA